MGPGFGNHWGDAFLAWTAIVVFAGALLGVGCYAGCSFVREHVSVEWRR